MELGPSQARVLGALVEKQLATPQHYPLTVNALVAACNQSTNRDPVVDYDEATVVAAADALKADHLVRLVLPSHGRSVVRYRHVLDEALGLDARQCALVAVLLLRGPQTVGELRQRTERMTEFTDLDELASELAFLAAREKPLAVRYQRQPGQKEERWATPLAGRVETPTDKARGVPAPGSGVDGDVSALNMVSDPPRAPGGTFDPPADRIGELGAELATLRDEVVSLRAELASLRAQLGG